ncbi:MAG: fructosamine kinase [Deltaproteobacteria bacterium]|nr:MAG: fructosamine kinase [Deltaproteobacteria bacterium]
MDRISRLLASAGVADGARQPLSGGDVGDVVRVGEVVVKTAASASPMFLAEARGLRTLGQTVRVPEVLHAGEQGLVMRYLAPGAADPAALGEAIAALHATHEPAYGRAEEVFLGRWRMPGGLGEDDWVRCRVGPLLAACRPTLGEALTRRIERVLVEMDPPREGPRRLHGDLWAGNVLHTVAGPAFIDPAQFAGERAADLAMMQLFGGFGGRCLEAYESCLPIPREVREHLDYYVLLYLLVHVWMFGGSYVASTAAAVRRLGW